jgi:hypothetical protein
MFLPPEKRIGLNETKENKYQNLVKFKIQIIILFTVIDETQRENYMLEQGKNKRLSRTGNVPNKNRVVRHADNFSPYKVIF